jgi:hypothetical protein
MTDSARKRTEEEEALALELRQALFAVLRQHPDLDMAEAVLDVMELGIELAHGLGIPKKLVLRLVTGGYLVLSLKKPVGHAVQNLVENR